jgi:cytosine/adenosine deaminase-related metal-dependent hydrolase
MAIALVLAAGCSHPHATPPVVTCATLAPLASGTCEVTPGDASTLIEGDVLAPATTYLDGQVAISPAGTIACVGCDCAAKVPAATRIVCPKGVVSPGLINTHDHLTNAQNLPFADTGERFEQRHDWRLGLRGHTQIPLLTDATQDQIAWAEVRFLMGGTTATAGVGAVPGLVRNLDFAVAEEGLDLPAVGTATFPLGDDAGEQLASGCGYPSIVAAGTLTGFDAWEAHVGEGIDDVAHNELACVSSSAGGGQDLLAPRTAVVQGIALDASDQALLAARGSSLVWSPRSNVALYGDTARVLEARARGTTIALGTDWIVTGSMNQLRELRCADDWNRDRLGAALSDADLWRMVTSNAARVTATGGAIGSLEAGKAADIAVFDGAARPGFRAVIDADPPDVALVMRGGLPLYGDSAILAALPSSANCETVDVCGAAKRICVESQIGESYLVLQSNAAGSYPAFSCGVPPGEPTCVPSRSVPVAGSTVYTGAITPTDADGDGIADVQDDCPAVFDPIRPMDGGAQPDSDGDGIGDACDPSP